MKRVIKARVRMEPSFIEHFRSSLLVSICDLVETQLLPVLNRRCAPYEKGKNTQDKGINKNFENIVGDATRSVLTQFGIPHWSAIGDELSDVARETENAIFQVDAKGCFVEDKDFSVKKDGLHGHCGKAQTSLVSTAPFTDRKTGQKHETRGIQKPFIERKPVYTLVAFLRWGYKDNQYYAESCGVIHLPHTAEDIKFNVGKSHDEMRWVIKNPALYHVHRFAYVSPLQILDSAQSECSDVPTTLQQVQ